MESLSEQLLYITVRLEGVTDHGTSVGTGFLYGYKNRVFIVTNKHVISGVKNGFFVLRKAQVSDGKKTLIAGQGYSVTFSEAAFIGHPSPSIDVAVMNVSLIISNLEAAGNLVYWKNISGDNRPKSEDIEKFISPLEEVIFVGYPSGIWDTTNLMPIMRKGITATPYYIFFQGEPKFLIDASVFPGSSGSPVFIYYAGTYPDKAGNAYIGNRLFFLGILAGVFYRTENGEIKMKEAPTTNIVVTEIHQMIDLGVVFNDSTIVECMDHYLEIAEATPKSSS
jgi:hypothetical protein